MKTVRIGIIGGGLMGREVASAFARWHALTDTPVTPVLAGVADLSESARAWFEKIPGVTMLTPDYRELLANPEIDVIYAAVPHHLHQEVYLEVLKAGKDLLAEKPFGAGLAAAETIAAAVKTSGRFVRCSSEFPFFPAARAAVRHVQKGNIGRILDVVSGFHHSSDLDPTKTANWKRLSAFCGEIGVMGDLGMHVCHVPFRLGWQPRCVFAQLQKGYAERPDGKGGATACDTWDNAVLHTWCGEDTQPFPVRFEMKRLAPGATNTWFFEVNGTEGGVRFSTAEPKTLHTFTRQPTQQWARTDLGFQTDFPAVTGGIFEFGFPDAIQQMWAAFLAEREGSLGDRFGCVTVDEALASHRLFHAALESQQSGGALSVPTATESAS